MEIRRNPKVIQRFMVYSFNDEKMRYLLFSDGKRAEPADSFFCGLYLMKRLNDAAAVTAGPAVGTERPVQTVFILPAQRLFADTRIDHDPGVSTYVV